MIFHPSLNLTISLVNVLQITAVNTESLVEGVLYTASKHTIINTSWLRKTTVSFIFFYQINARVPLYIRHCHLYMEGHLKLHSLFNPTLLAKIVNMYLCTCEGSTTTRSRKVTSVLLYPQRRINILVSATSFRSQISSGRKEFQGFL